MTLNERDQQRAQVLFDLEKAESELGSLRTKAIRTSDAIITIAQKIQQNANLAVTSEDFSPEYEMQNRFSPQSQTDFIRYEDAIKLIEDLKVARQKVLNLRQQKIMTQ